MLKLKKTYVITLTFIRTCTAREAFGCGASNSWGLIPSKARTGLCKTKRSDLASAEPGRESGGGNWCFLWGLMSSPRHLSCKVGGWALVPWLDYKGLELSGSIYLCKVETEGWWQWLLASKQGVQVGLGLQRCLQTARPRSLPGPEACQDAAQEPARTQPSSPSSPLLSLCVSSQGKKGFVVLKLSC